MTYDRDNARALIAGLRSDAGDYGRMKRGEVPAGELVSWDQSQERAWQAADALDTAPSAVPVEGDREALAEVFRDLDGRNDIGKPWDADYEYADAVLAAGFTRSPLPVEGEVEWEHVPGSIAEDGRVFVGQGVIDPDYVPQFIAEGGKVIRRKVGPWEEVPGE